MFANTSLTYPFLLILSIGKKSCENLGRTIKKSGDTIRRWLRPASESFELMQGIAFEKFRDKRTITIAIDDTQISKTHSSKIVGAGMFYNTKIGRKILSLKVLVTTVSDGILTIPVAAAFLFDSALVPTATQIKNKLVQDMIIAVLKLFPNKAVIVVADGAFATIEFFTWCLQNSISAELRMHSNRKVLYKGKEMIIREIADLQPKGRQMARTICVLWHGMLLHITAQRRIDKHGKETIVYQAATYTASPAQHVKAYMQRWPIEKVFRTTKQHLGLQDCYSTKLETQLDHVAGVLLSYALVQLEMQRGRFDTPEATIRHFKTQNLAFLERRMSALDQIFGV